MKKSLAEHLFSSIKWAIGALFGGSKRFFTKMRNVDVDEVGKAMFRHCTSPKALYVTLFERWWIVTLMAVLGGCFGMLVIMKAEEAFETHGGILIYQKTPNLMDDSMKIPDPKAYDSLFATHVQLISSPLIVEKAIHDFHLEEECPGIVAKVDHETTFEHYILKNLKTSRAGSGDSAGAFVINVGFGHTNSEECKTVVNAILDTYRTHVNESLLFDQQQALKLVLESRDDLEIQVSEKNKAYRDFLKSAPGVWNKMTDSNPHHERVDQLEKEFTELELEKIALESRIRIMRQTHDPITGLPLTDIARLALIDEVHINRLQLLSGIRKEEIAADAQKAYPQIQESENAKFDKLLDLYAERTRLLQNMGSEHPAVVDIEASIKEMETLIDRLKDNSEDEELPAKELVEAYVRMLDKELSDTNVRIEFVENRIKKEVELAKELNDFTVKAKLLETEYTQAQEMYQTVVDKVQKQDLIKQYGNFVAEIVARPHKIEVTWPKKPVILALCTIMGIFGGSFIAITLDLIAYTPLRSAFVFIPKWLLGGPSQTAQA